MSRDKGKTTILNLYTMWIYSIYFAVLTREDLIDTALLAIREVVFPLSLSGILDNKAEVFQVMMLLVGKWGAWLLVAVIVWLIGRKILLKKLQNIDGTTILGRLESVKNYLAMTGIFIEMIWAAFFYASFSIPYSEAFIFIAMQCLAAKIIIDDHSQKEWKVILVLITFGIVCKLYTDRNFVLRTILLIAAFKDLDLKKVMKWYLVVNGIAIVTTVAISGFGIAGTWMETEAYRSDVETANRYALGFNSPNTTHFVIVRLALIAMYIWWDKLEWWHIVTFLAINHMLYIFTDSRTGMLVGLAAGILAIFFRYFKKMRDKKIWYIAGECLIVVLTIFSLCFFQWNFQQYDSDRSCPDWVYRVNGLMVGRIHQMLKFKQGIELSPFGTYQSGVYIDMGYVKLFLQEGFIAFGLYLATMIRLIKKQYRIKDYAGYIIVIAVSIRMLMESSFVPFVFQNPALMLAMGCGILCDSEKECASKHMERYKKDKQAYKTKKKMGK